MIKVRINLLSGQRECMFETQKQATRFMREVAKHFFPQTAENEEEQAKIRAIEKASGLLNELTLGQRRIFDESVMRRE